MKGKDSVRSVERTIEILRVFTAQNTELSLAQICMEVPLPKTTIYRILSTLVEGHLVFQDYQTGKYRLGYEMIRFGAIAQEGNPLNKVAREEMERVSMLTRQTSNLYVREGRERICIAQVTGPQYVQRYSYLGARYPLYCGAGKLLLAYSGEAFQKRYFEECTLEPFTANTITDKEKLKEDLAAIRSQGYSASRGERDSASAMVAVPLRDYSGEVIAAMTVSGPISFFTDRHIEEYRKQLLQAAELLSEKLGYRGGKN